MKKVNNQISESAEYFILGKNKFKNCAGTSDNTDYWKSKEFVYQLVINYRLSYIGLSVFNTKQNDNTENPISASNEIFLQDSNCEEILGKNWENKSAAYLRRVLENYCY